MITQALGFSHQVKIRELLEYLLTTLSSSSQTIIETDWKPINQLDKNRGAII